MFQKLSDKEEEIGKQIVDIAIKIHKKLGPGLLESIYAKCFYYEMQSRFIAFEKRKECSDYL
jgi:GxxExxY protein